MSGAALSQELARRADELLGDGEWHSYEQTVRALIRYVPPGRAMRQNEQDRIGTDGPPVRKMPRSPEELITNGARTIVRSFLRSSAVYEHDRFNGTRYDQTRRIRQVGKHRALTGDPYRQRRDQLEYQLELAQDQVKALRAHLIEIGQEDVADRLAPEA